MKSRWHDGRLDLGRLGNLEIRSRESGCVSVCFNPGRSWWYRKTETDVRRVSIRWLRAALKEAGKRIGEQ